METPTDKERTKRLLFLAERLFQMTDAETWRATGGDDGQGHYEGDYHAENVAEEPREHREYLTANELCTRVVREGKAPPEEEADDPVHLPALLSDSGLASSTSEARRLIGQGAVRIDGRPVAELDVPRTRLEGALVQVGKRRFMRFIYEERTMAEQYDRIALKSMLEERDKELVAAQERIRELEAEIAERDKVVTQYRLRIEAEAERDEAESLLEGCKKSLGIQYERTEKAIDGLEDEIDKLGEALAAAREAIREMLDFGIGWCGPLSEKVRLRHITDIGYKALRVEART